jgi:hypothetical protein
MPHPYYPAGNPKFNHVALSVPSDLLDETNRADLCHYFGEVLGFDQMPTETIDRKRLVANDEPMRCPRTDHYGFAVRSLDDLLGARDRAVAFREKDPRVDLDDYAVDDQKVVKIHSIYVRYLLPMTCELQYWEFPES